MVIVPVKPDEPLMDWARRFYIVTDTIPDDETFKAHGLVPFVAKDGSSPHNDEPINLNDALNNAIGKGSWFYSYKAIWCRDDYVAIKLRFELGDLVEPLRTGN